jgi:hypothetical protein
MTSQIVVSFYNFTIISKNLQYNMGKANNNKFVTPVKAVGNTSAKCHSSLLDAVRKGLNLTPKSGVNGKTMSYSRYDFICL